MLKTLTNGIPCLPSEGSVMGSVSMHSAVCACSRAEVHTSREVLLPSPLYCFCFCWGLCCWNCSSESGAPVHSQGNRSLSQGSLSVFQVALLVILSRVCLPYIDRFFMLTWKFTIQTSNIKRAHEKQDSNYAAWELSLTSWVVPVGHVSLNNASYLLYN